MSRPGEASIKSDEDHAREAVSRCSTSQSRAGGRER